MQWLTHVWGDRAGFRVCDIEFGLTYVWGSSAEPQHHQQRLPETVAASICEPFCTHWGVGWYLCSPFDLRPVTAAVDTCSCGPFTRKRGGGGGPPLDCPQQSLNYNDNLYAFWLGVCGASLVSPEQSVLNALQGLLMRQGVMSALIARI